MILIDLILQDKRADVVVNSNLMQSGKTISSWTCLARLIKMLLQKIIGRACPNTNLKKRVYRVLVASQTKAP